MNLVSITEVKNIAIVLLFLSLLLAGFKDEIVILGLWVR